MATIAVGTTLINSSNYALADAYFDKAMENCRAVAGENCTEHNAEIIANACRQAKTIASKVGYSVGELEDCLYTGSDISVTFTDVAVSARVNPARWFVRSRAAGSSSMEGICYYITGDLTRNVSPAECR